MNNDNAQKLRLEIFEKTGLKVDEDDPIIQLFLVQDTIMKTSINEFQITLNGLGDALISEITKQQNHILSSFDGKRDELLSILEKLENQKEAIVADVWKKLDSRITDKVHNQLSEDMQAIANNANNKINNQRNIFIGIAVGLLIGFIFAFLVLLFK